MKSADRGNESALIHNKKECFPRATPPPLFGIQREGKARLWSYGLRGYVGKAVWRIYIKQTHLLTSFIGVCLQATLETYMWGEAILKLMSVT